MIELLILFAAASPTGQIEPCPVPETSAKSILNEVDLEFAALGQIEREVVQIYRDLRPSLVQVQLPAVSAETWTEEEPDDRRAAKVGFVVSGVVLRETPLGCLVVIPGVWQASNRELKVIDLDGQSFDARPISQTEKYGITLLQVDGLCIEAPPFGLCEVMPLGSMTIALGNPFGLDGTISMGMLSGRGRNLGNATDLIQITNPLNPGDGGGIIADSKGRLVAIAMSSLSEIARVKGWNGDEGSHGSEMTRARGISFGIPLHLVLKEFTEHFQLASENSRPQLGLEVQVAVIPSEVRRNLGIQMRTGLRVLKVDPNTPAHLAKVQVGDFILGLGGQPTRDFADLFAALRIVNASSLVQILREENTLELQLEFPSQQATESISTRGRRMLLSPPALQEIEEDREEETPSEDG